MLIVIKDSGNDDIEEGDLNFGLENLADITENDSENDNENALGSFTFNRKERLDVKKPGPFFPNSENNFFFKKVRKYLEIHDIETKSIFFQLRYENTTTFFIICLFIVT